MPQNLDHPAVAVLVSFLSAMNAYETDCAKASEAYFDDEKMDEDAYEQALESQRRCLQDIFERHCVAHSNAKILEDKGSFEEPPRHQLEEPVSIEEKGGKVIITTELKRRPFYLYQYELVEEEGQWLIKDHVKYRSPKAEKWTSQDLLF